MLELANRSWLLDECRETIKPIINEGPLNPEIKHLAPGLETLFMEVMGFFPLA